MPVTRTDMYQPPPDWTGRCFPNIDGALERSVGARNWDRFADATLKLSRCRQPRQTRPGGLDGASRSWLPPVPPQRVAGCAEYRDWKWRLYFVRESVDGVSTGRVGSVLKRQRLRALALLTGMLAEHVISLAL